MKKVTIQSFLIFLAGFLITSSVSLFTKLNLYPALLVSDAGIKQEFEDSISLAYLIDERTYVNSLGEPLQIEHTAVGWMLIVIINFGLPFLIAYSFYLKKSKD